MSLNHVHEVSSLYRTFRPNFTSYRSNGDGRDIYIQYNNGGFWDINPSPFSAKIPHRLNYRFHSLSSFRTPPFKYRSDGKGRDSYIISNNGGLSYNNQSLKNCKLETYLRTDYNFYKPVEFINNNNLKRFMSKKEYFHNLQIKKKEKELINRLYNKEKHKFIKKNNVNNENNFNDNNEFLNYKDEFLNNNSHNNFDMNKKYNKEMEKKHNIKLTKIYK